MNGGLPCASHCVLLVIFLSFYVTSNTISICICMYMYTCAFTRPYMCVCEYVCAAVHMCIFIYTYIRINKYVCVFVYLYMIIKLLDNISLPRSLLDYISYLSLHKILFYFPSLVFIMSSFQLCFFY